jgi:hypothetical protein
MKGSIMDWLSKNKYSLVLLIGISFIWGGCSDQGDLPRPGGSKAKSSDEDSDDKSIKTDDGESEVSDGDDKDLADTDENAGTADGEDLEEEPLVGCAGKEVGGYCWYLASKNDGDSMVCSDKCKDHGGFDLEGTQKYIGYEGSVENCKLVMDALEVGETGDFVKSNSTGIGLDMGCYEDAGMRQYNARDGHLIVDATTAAWGNLKRACACKH